MTAPDRTAPDPVGRDRAVPDQSAPDRPVPDLSASDRSVPDRTGSPGPHRSLRTVLGMLRLSPRSLIAAIASATLTLASALALAAVSAWLVTRAWERPSVMDLTIAVAAVRGLGITRAFFRYADRLLTHDLALRGVVELRAGLYTRLAAADPAPIAALRRGDLLARLGKDVEEIGDVVIRSLVPAAVAVLIGIGATVLIGLFEPFAAVAVAVALVLATVVSPVAAYVAARRSETAVVARRGDLTAATLTAVDHAAELRVARGFAGQLGVLRAEQQRFDAAIDTAALPNAVSTALIPLATGLATVAALLTGAQAFLAGDLTVPAFGIVVLTPLSVFEAAGAMPAAASQYARSTAAAQRLLELSAPARDVAHPNVAVPDTASEGADRPDTTQPTPARPDTAQSAPARPDTAQSAPARPDTARPDTPSPDFADQDFANQDAAVLRAAGAATAWPGGPVVTDGIDLEIGPGTRLAVIGPSGEGKSTLLATLAGLIRPARGTVTLDGTPIGDLDPATVRSRVVWFAEDAHVFATTVRENLRVARGDASDEEITAALEAVGLGRWLAAQAPGLDLMLTADAATLSGGERRRLLLARALLSSAPIVLLDEPTEHLEAGAGDALLGRLLASEDGLFGPDRAVVVVSHRTAAAVAAPETVRIGRGAMVTDRRRRGTEHRRRGAEEGP